MSIVDQTIRETYASEVAVYGGVKSEALLRAYAAVPRERMLPRGPWVVEALDGSYYVTDDADVSRILHAVGVSIDPKRQLNSGNPAEVGRILEEARFEPGETVFHVGAGLGYFSAIMAEMVGASGRVIAAEVDPVLAWRCRINLEPWQQVEVVGDALACSLPPVDVIFVSTGIARIPASWLDVLRPGGRLIFPLTGSLNGGFIFRIEKGASASWLSAKPLNFARFYPCLGARDPAALSAIDQAIADPRGSHVRSLRLDAHAPQPDCWLHSDGWCLSTAANDHSDRTEPS
ncbi:Protein-L-isoaspartate(D-aspartate) O-methyltransferase [uncultured Alphaproteobacteria bacterium]|uniref:Protein-L-isoaspartate O-methyltransferase n=1 Tax=uncultured Alphaproteobacteria bacterium TaxID=91750 RepID=A0A212JMB9_9PROT|nr:Protein-L-isoaspartate(D-aspartate) O-methyltransferase [uncultured Alphaproteobacteria bacterium]